MEEKRVVVNSGVGFTGLLQLVFIVLKLLGVINWQWILVLLPAIISVGIAVLWYIIALIIYILF